PRVRSLPTRRSSDLDWEQLWQDSLCDPHQAHRPDGATNESPKDVAATFITWHYPIADQHQCRTHMICDVSQAHVVGKCFVFGVLDRKSTRLNSSHVS